jgi:Na+/H+ antiporter NhaD/arsenite permease-like protein
MEATTTAGLILIPAGILAMLGSALNWRIVTHSGKLFNMIFGDKVARVIYFVVGIFVFVKGIELLVGAHWLPF